VPHRAAGLLIGKVCVTCHTPVLIPAHHAGAADTEVFALFYNSSFTVAVGNTVQWPLIGAGSPRCCIHPTLSTHPAHAPHPSGIIDGSSRRPRKTTKSCVTCHTGEHTDHRRLAPTAPKPSPHRATLHTPFAAKQAQRGRSSKTLTPTGTQEKRRNGKHPRRNPVKSANCVEDVTCVR